MYVCLQPAATNKDKPSKLRQRKHQIGSLFYEMKQKEMELVDQHAKGHLSKAETQAKYSW
jgi:proline-rich protein PRCC